MKKSILAFFLLVSILIFNPAAFSQISPKKVSSPTTQDPYSLNIDPKTLEKAVTVPKKVLQEIAPKLQPCATMQKVKVEGAQLMVDFNCSGEYQRFLIKGVAYQPVPVGRSPSDWEYNIFDKEEILTRDFSLLEQMHANTIRIWKGNDTQDGTRYQNKLTKNTLDEAEEHGLKVIAGFYMPPSNVTETWGVDYSTCDDPAPSQGCKDLLQDFKDYVTQSTHPAILFWAIGNENNYELDRLSSGQKTGFYYLVNEMARQAKIIEGSAFHPVALVNGDINDIGTGVTLDSYLTNIDIWGANVYRAAPDYFKGLFDEFSQKSSKAFWIAEYGIDAIDGPGKNATKEDENQPLQAQADVALWNDIKGAYDQGKIIGGTLMEYSDEWWKPWSEDDGCTNGCSDGKHQFDGYEDNCEAQPDGFCHEEWWGMMSVIPDGQSGDKIKGDGLDTMVPRQVYYDLQQKWQ